MTSIITRRGAVTALSALLLPTTLLGEGNQPSSSDPLSLELSGVALPVVRSGRLVNYLFGVIKVQLSDSPATLFLRERPYLLRDAIIRIASRSPIPEGDSPKTFDRVAVTRLVLRAIEAIRPGTRVVRVTVIDPAFMRN